LESLLKISWLSSFVENKLSLVIDRPEGCEETINHFSLNRLSPYQGVKRKDLDKFKELLVGLSEEGFRPSTVLLHWLWPGIKFEGCIYSVWPKTELNIVVHSDKYLRHLQSSSLTTNLFFRNAGLAKSFRKDIPYKVYPSPISDVFFDRKQGWDSRDRCYDLLVVGNLLKRKNVDLVVDVATALNLSLLIIGEGPERKRLQGKIETNGVNARILPWCTQPELKTYYQSSKILALPSKKEAFGLVYFEAMSQGCVPIGLINEGADGHIVNGEEGLLIDDACPLKLKNAVEHILYNFELFSKNALLGSERFSRVYFLDWFAENVLKSVE
jgi:glycosyltransferase involved in cell wall biosynthesis